jgi:uncharacterized membrane protein YGL010W
MNTLPQQLAAYAAYHRDWRNCSHFVGIPAIVLSSASLLSRRLAGGRTAAVASRGAGQPCWRCTTCGWIAVSAC